MKKRTLLAVFAALTISASSMVAFSSCETLEGIPVIGPFISGLLDKESSSEEPEEVKLQKLEITTEPTKTAYIAGEVFDPTGMVVTAVYSDKSEKVVTDYTYSKEPLTVEDTRVSIEWEGKKVSQKITVKNDVVEATVKTPATKTVYMVGETFSPAGMVISVKYENGETADIEISAENATWSTGALTGDETEITVKYAESYEFKQAITFAKGVFIEAESGEIVSSTVDINTDSADATGGAYVGDMKSGDTVTFIFNSDKKGEGEVSFRLASQYLKEDSNWTPIWMGDCQLNKIMEVYVNDVKQTIADDIILPGGGESGGTPDANLWFKWRDVEFGAVGMIEGRNTITIKFIPHDYNDCSQSSFNGKFTANVDSLKVTSAECAISPYDVKTWDVQGVALEEVDGSAYFVVTGNVNYVGYTASEVEAIASALNKKIGFDFQGDLAGESSGSRLLNTASDRVITVEAGATAGVATYTMKVNVDSLTGSMYSTHINLGQGLINFDKFTANVAPEMVKTGEANSIAANHKIYTLVYNWEYSKDNPAEDAPGTTSELRKENYYGCIGLNIVSDGSVLTVAQPAWDASKLDLIEENGNVYMVLAGSTTITSTGYTEAEIKKAIGDSFRADANGNLNSDGLWTVIRPNNTIVELTAGEGEGVYNFTAKFSLINDKYVLGYTYMIKCAGTMTSNDNQNGDVKLAVSETNPCPNDNKAIKVNGIEYTIMATNSACWTVVSFVTKDATAPALTMTSIALEERDGKAVAVLTGVGENLSADTLANYVIDGDNGGRAVWAYTYTLGENGAIEIVIDLSQLTNAGFHYMHAGFAATPANLPEADALIVEGKSELTVGNKTYTLGAQYSCRGITLAIAEGEQA